MFNSIKAIFNDVYIPKGSTTNIVPDPGKGVCADPRRGDAILGMGGPGPPVEDSEHQLSLDRAGEKTQ
jgi:hypothetical protein